MYLSAVCDVPLTLKTCFFSRSFFLPHRSHYTDIMRKTVKLMINISNKSNHITINLSLISNGIMHCPHQHQMLIS